MGRGQKGAKGCLGQKLVCNKNVSRLAVKVSKGNRQKYRQTDYLINKYLCMDVEYNSCY